MAEVKLTILGEDKSGPARQGLHDTEKAIGMVKTAAAALGVAMTVMTLVNYAKDATLMAARYETLGVTMTVVGNNAGYTGEQMRGFQESLQKTGIAMIEARQNLTTMAQAHIDLASASKLARIAQDAGTIGAINSSEAFSRMIVGIQSGQVDILRTIGLNVNFEDSYKKLAKQLGKSAEDLTEYEKAQARTNAVIDKGKDIAGAYEAAMGTAGKQIQSLKRYGDNLKVTLGGIFQDVLIVAVEGFTKALKTGNKEADDLAQKGQLKKWGEELVVILAVMADGIQIAFNALNTLVLTGVAGLTQLYYGAKAFGQALIGDFSGAKESFNNILNTGTAWSALVKKQWEGSTKYQDAARKMFSDRDANTGADKAKNDALQKKLIAAGEASRAEQQAKDAAALSEKKYLENLKSSLSTITEYAKALSDLGKERLKFADERYADQLKKEVALYQEGKATANDLITPLKRYNVEVNDVYNQRLAIEQGALGKIGALYDDFKQKVSLSANTKEVKQHGVDIVKAYKTTAEQIIAVEQNRYSTLYEGEKKTYEQFKALNDAKKKEIKELKIAIDEANKAYDEKRRTAVSDYSGGFGYLNQNLDELAKRQAMVDKLQRDEAEASAIQDPARQKDKLLAVSEAWMQLTTKVDLSGQTVITTEQAWQTAMDERQRIQTKIFGTLENAQKLAAEGEEKASGKLEIYKQKMLELDDILKNMTRTITIDLKVNGMQAIQQIQGFVGQATASPFSSGTTSSTTTQSGSNPSGMSTSDYYQSGDSMYWGDGTYAGPAAASGTNYIAKSGWLFGHEGEAIIPEKYNPDADGSTSVSTTPVTIQGGINITIQSTGQADLDADAIARQIVPSLKKYLGRSL